MCGASSQQNNVEQEQNEFYQQAITEQSAAYSEDQEVLNQMKSIYSPILAKGPNQQGFSQEELDSLNTGAVEGTAENYESAAKAVNEEVAAEGGGNADLPSGGATELKAQTAAAAAQQESSEENQIEEADYSQGYNEWQNAATGLATVAGQLNPTAYENAATSAGSATSTTANEIAQENNSWINAAIGAAGSIGGAVIDQNPGGIFGPSCWVAAELYGGWTAARTVAVRRWINEELPKRFAGRVLLRLYVRYGRQIARRIRTHRVERSIMQAIFDRIPVEVFHG